MNATIYSDGILYGDWSEENIHRSELIEKMRCIKDTSSIFQQLNLVYVSQNVGEDFIMPSEGRDYD